MCLLGYKATDLYIVLQNALKCQLKLIMSALTADTAPALFRQQRACSDDKTIQKDLTRHFTV
jgi:hypothetical protein